MGMTDRDKKVLAGILALVVLGGFWFLVVGKKRSQIKEANAALASAQAQLDQSKAAEAQARLAAKVKPAAYSRLLRLGKAIPVDDDFESLLVQVSNITNSAGVSFNTLTQADSAAANVGATGETTCDQGASGASGAAPAAAPTGGASGTTGSTAQTFVGRSRDKANGAVAASQQDAAAKAAADAAACQTSPTLTDITAQAAGLTSTSYSLNFTGSFYDLKAVFDGLMNMVKVNNARVTATGRLLDINQITLAVGTFPNLTAQVSMTGYQTPASPATTEAASNGASTTPAAAPAAAEAPSTGGQ